MFEVNEIDVQNFHNFFRHRPNLDVYHHDRYTFEDSMQHICDSVAKYRGDRIQDYFGELPKERQNENSFDFISKLKNVKTLELTTYKICIGDLVDAIKRLAGNDTVEMLYIGHSMEGQLDEINENCTFCDRPDHDDTDMERFSHLKTINISGEYWYTSHQREREECDPLTFVRVYGPQILSNVENLMISLDLRI